MNGDSYTDVDLSRLVREHAGNDADVTVVVMPETRSDAGSVVLDRNGILLGTIEQSDPAPRALDAMNPTPQTIRPDMTPRLARKLLSSNPYLMVTTAKGKYLGRYVPEE